MQDSGTQRDRIRMKMRSCRESAMLAIDKVGSIAGESQSVFAFSNS
jgi:hypothetical protein